MAYTTSQAAKIEKQAADLSLEDAARITRLAGEDAVDGGWLYADDACSLEIIADHIERNELSSALSYASLLDTAVREEIPSTVWAKIGGELLIQD